MIWAKRRKEQETDHHIMQTSWCLLLQAKGILRSTLLSRIRKTQVLKGHGVYGVVRHMIQPPCDQSWCPVKSKTCKCLILSMSVSFRVVTFHGCYQGLTLPCGGQVRLWFGTGLYWEVGLKGVMSADEIFPSFLFSSL